ncbi:unnamed protein product [Protopolystoma xenopodis]|uniref:Uncharacterized protein n=1 Tax=Protopolystoma xenopodis TaxID=117903 RepID=A0A448X583_9PLAT|nr:unnamed protein product [Protopolystoma xenopodis]
MTPVPSDKPGHKQFAGFLLTPALDASIKPPEPAYTLVDGRRIGASCIVDLDPAQSTLTGPSGTFRLIQLGREGRRCALLKYHLVPAHPPAVVTTPADPGRRAEPPAARPTLSHSPNGLRRQQASSREQTSVGPPAFNVGRLVPASTNTPAVCIFR